MLQYFIYLAICGTIQNLVSGQSMYAYQTNNATKNVQLTQGPSLSGINGTEINLWVRPQINTYVNSSGVASALFMQVSTDLRFQIIYNADEPSLCLTFTQGAATNIYKGYLPQISNNIWVNLNIRIYYNLYILMTGWQGNQWTEINPTFKLQQTYAPIYSDTSLVMLATSNEIGVAWAGLRVYKLDYANSWGQFLRSYQGASSFSQLMQEITIYQNFTMSIFSNSSVVNITGGGVIEQVIMSSSGTIYKQCALSKTFASSGDCTASCSTNCSVCQIIDYSYNTLCRQCISGTSATCTSYSTCPSGYYKQNGVCVRCPVGCATCSSGTICTSCDPGLNIYSITAVGSSTVQQLCQCTTSQYTSYALIGTRNTASCINCDASCLTCSQASTNCTSCAASTFLYNNMCITSCSAAVSNYYGETSNNTCIACPSNCLACTAYNNCTTCGIIAANNTQYYNFNGSCVTYCNSSSIANPTQYKCNPCSYNCYQCSGNINNCSQCVWGSGYSLYNAGCVSSCPAGFYSSSQICLACPSSCTTCTTATTCWSCAANYYYVNNQCVSTCPNKFYPDSSDPAYYYCRACPSSCYQCAGSTQCTQCVSGYYMLTSGTTSLCVSQSNCGSGFYPQNSTQSCQPCLSNCNKCTSGSTCTLCVDGYYLNPTTQTCVQICPSGTYASTSGVCLSCINSCQTCSNQLLCSTCGTGYMKLGSIGTACVSSCPPGYYTSSSILCLECQATCLTCTTYSNCGSCVAGYSLNSGTCLNLCGNSIRNSYEQCDDGNQISGDGCSSTCLVEDGFICQPATPTSVGPDTCRCDPILLQAEWDDNWGQIILDFGTQLNYSSSIDVQSSDPQQFCSQILDPTTTAALGSFFQCTMWSSDQGTTIYINVGRDSLLGSTASSYQTSIQFLDTKLMVQGCTLTSIPLTYIVMNMPLSTPKVNLATSTGSNSVGLCQSTYGLNILYSKGLTKRNIQSVWSVVQLLTYDAYILATIQSGSLTTFTNMHFLWFQKNEIESLAGKTLTFKSTVTNFLGQQGQNVTILQFLNTKKIEIYDLTDVLTLQISQDNRIYPRFRLSYCTSENTTNTISDYLKITYSCQFYAVNTPSVVKTLSNCNITNGSMSIGTQYAVTVNAMNSQNPSQNTNKVITINPASPTVIISGIKGCNSLFSPNNSFSLFVNFNTNPANAQFSWSCFDIQSSSTCFSINYQYITLGNTQNITVDKNLLFPNHEYEFSVTVTDIVTSTSNSYTCSMFSSSYTQSVITFNIASEANSNGFMDFDRRQNAFKAQLTTNASINKLKLTYQWSVTDASNTTFDNTVLSIYKNSMGVPTSLLKRSNQYTIYAYITDGVSIGYQTVIYNTDPDISFEFQVEPANGVALSTPFYFSVTSQIIYESLQSYVYGYISPIDGTTLVPVFQKTYLRYIIMQLPPPVLPLTTIQCYAQIITSSGAIKTYFQNVTVTSPTLTVSAFNSQVQQMVMDDLIQSLQLVNQLTYIGSQLTQVTYAAAVARILDGLQNETTPLSDLYTQASVASIMDFISQNILAVAKVQPSILTRTAQIFAQITTLENIQIGNGKYVKFKKSATDSLFNYANNIFQQDFSALIGTANQQSIKTSIMAGLKNLLKGSLSNCILGNNGGYIYQGQNMSARAIKYDQMETQYKLNVTLPLSVAGKLSQNFVNITLPLYNGNSNPCVNYEACQVSVVILDAPLTPFLSNSKDAVLKSIFVDMSLQQTELACLNNAYINIQELNVVNLNQTINITMPLLTALNTSNPNKTLSCGYLDTADQIFKITGTNMLQISDYKVTCLTQHLTAFGIQEYTGALVTASPVASDPAADAALQAATNKAAILKSWAVWLSLALLLSTIFALLWGYRKDNSDEMNYQVVNDPKRKLYVGLCLDPNKVEDEDKPLKKKNKKGQQYVITSQQLDKEKNQQHDQLEYEQLENTQRLSPDRNYQPEQSLEPNANSPYQPQHRYHPSGPINLQPYPMNEPEDDFDQLSQKQQKIQDMEQSVLNNTKDLLVQGEDIPSNTMRTTKRMKKKKKKKKSKGDNDMNSSVGFDKTMQEFRSNKVFGQTNQMNDHINDQRPQDNQNQHNIFFEGGDKLSERDNIQNDYIYEGGDSDKSRATDGEDEAAQTIKSKRTKRAAKKKSLSRKNSHIANGDINETNQLETTIKTARSSRSKKSSRSTGKHKKTQLDPSSKNKASVTKQQSEKIVPFEVISQLGDDKDELKMTAKSGLKEKKKRASSRKGSRASSRTSSRKGSIDLSRPDKESAIIVSSSPGRKSPLKLQSDNHFSKSPSPNKKLLGKKKNTSQGLDNIQYNEQQLNANDLQVEQIDDENPINTQDNIPSKSSKGFAAMAQQNDVRQNTAVSKIKAAKSSKGFKQVKRSKVKGPKKSKEDASGCCVYFCYSWIQSHRMCSIYKHYNVYLPRTARVLLLVMSLMMYMMISGLLMGSNQIVNTKDQRNEQYTCGMAAALITKILVIFLSNLMRHPKPFSQYVENQGIYLPVSKIKSNKIRYFIGLSITAIFIFVAFAYAFILSQQLQGDQQIYWAWSFLFAIIADFIILELIILTFSVIVIMILGSSPDACGDCRNGCLRIVLQSAKDSVR